MTKRELREAISVTISNMQKTGNEKRDDLIAICINYAEAEKEQTRQWLINEDFEGLAERI